MRRKRLASVTASRWMIVVCLCLIAGGCGTNAAVERAQRDVDRIKTQLSAEQANVARLRRQIGSLEAQVDGLKKRLRPFEQRAGLAPFDGGTISRANGASIEKISGTVVTSASDRGRKQALSKHIAGRRGAVIGFWATWCKPCIADAELKHMKTLASRLKLYDVDFISTLIDDLGKAQAHEKSTRWIYPLWFIKDGHMNMLPRSMVQRVGLGLPFFLVVDRKGAIRWFHKGKLNDANVQDLLTAAARL